MPRIAQGLATLTHSPQLMITDGEAYLVEEPAVIGAKNHEGRSYAGWMPYSRVFESLWHGRRHALVGPEIGRASCRERVCQYVSISVVAVSLKKKKTTRAILEDNTIVQKHTRGEK